MKITDATKRVNDVIQMRLENPAKWDEETTQALQMLVEIAELATEQFDESLIEGFEREPVEVEWSIVVEYIEQGGNFCLYCRSENIETEGEVIGAHREVDCLDCGAQWEDCMGLVGVILKDQGYVIPLVHPDTEPPEDDRLPR